MAMPIIISFLAGTVLGQRFKVLILIPTSIIAVTAAIGVGLAQALDGWSIALMVLAVMTALQVGYVVGTGIQYFMTAPRAGHPLSQTSSDRADLHRAH
jgi:hypothetical protein